MEGGTDIFVMDESFDQLLTQAAANVSDTQAFLELKTQFATIHEAGQVEQLMQMAMALGATACLHPHLEGLATEMSGLYGNQKAGSDENPSHAQSEQSNKACGCKNCKAGKTCSRKYASIFATYLQ